MIGKSLGHAVTLLLLTVQVQVASYALISSTEDYHRNEEDNRELGGRRRRYGDSSPSELQIDSLE